jgi:hypothetical protein
VAGLNDQGGVLGEVASEPLDPRQLGTPAGVEELSELAVSEAPGREPASTQLALDLLAADDELLASGGGIATGTPADHPPGGTRPGQFGVGRHDEVEVALEERPVASEPADEGDVIACERRQVLRQLRPGVAMMAGGGIGLLLSAFTAFITGIVYLASLQPTSFSQYRDGSGAVLLVAGVGAVLSAATLAIGVVVFRRASARRDEYQATLTAIDERLDAYERGELAASVPPPPAPPPPLEQSAGVLHVVAVDALTAQPLKGFELTAGDTRRRADALGVVDLTVDPGPVQLVATLEGYREAREVIRAVAGRRADVTLRLVPEGQEAPSRLSGQVRSADDGKPLAATIDVGGKTFAADARGIFSFELPPGRHTVRIVAPGYVVQMRQLELKEGARVIFNADLQRP